MGCFELGNVDFHKFHDENEFDSYLRKLLKTNMGRLIGAVAGNITLLLVNQDNKRTLKVFPWNQILVSNAERMELADMFYDFYHDSLQWLCRCEIQPGDGVFPEWGNEQLACLPELFDILETEGYYPVFAQTCAPDAEHGNCYLDCICVIDKSKQ